MNTNYKPLDVDQKEGGKTNIGEYLRSYDLSKEQSVNRIPSKVQVQISEEVPK